MEKIPEEKAENSSNSFHVEDVSMDSTTYSFGYRSPSAIAGGCSGAGNTSPGQGGRTIREHNEHLNTLRKENFNLKLRIYFLEEKKGNPSDGGTDSLYKQNIDLKVETEALRQELKEKQELLCEAATALDLMEKEQKKSQDESASIIEELQQKIQHLELDIKTLENAPNVDANGAYCDFLNRSKTDLDAQQKIVELEEYIRQYEIKTSEMSSKLNENEFEIKQLKYQLSELQDALAEKEQLHTKENVLTLKNQIFELKKELCEKSCLLDTNQDELAQKTKAFEKSCKSVQIMMIKIKNLETELEKLKANESQTESLQESQQNNLSTTSQYLCEITNLNEKLKISNADAHRWQREYVDATGVLTARLCELAEFLDSLLKQKDVLSVLAQDRRRAIRKAIDKSLDLSKTINNLSQSISINDSLNFNDSTLFSFRDSILNNNKENIQNSFGINSSMLSTNQAKMIENLRAEVKNLRSELDKSGGSCATDGNGTKKERKSIVIDPNSESEAWSEPDRKVSSARIGLEDSTKLLSINANNTNCSNANRSTNKFLDSLNSTTASDDDAAGGASSSKLSTRKNSSSTTNNKLQERIVELELQISERDNRILENQCKLVEVDNRFHEEKLKILEIKKELDCYKIANDQLERELMQTREINEKLQHEIDNIQIEFEKLQTEKETVFIDLRASQQKQSALENDIKELNSIYNKQMNELLTKQKLTMINREIYDKQNIELNIAERDLFDAKTKIDLLTDNECELNAQILENDKQMRSMKQCLDSATLQASKMVVDRNTALSEKQNCEKLCSELQEKLNDLEQKNEILQSRITQLSSHTSSVSVSKYQLSKSASHGNARYMMSQLNADYLLPCDYTSADEINYRLNNSSPDLGIDSDAGRTSGSEGRYKFMAMTKKELSDGGAAAAFSTLESDNNDNVSNIGSTSPFAAKEMPIFHDCRQIEKEYEKLKLKLVDTHSTYKKILEKLRLSNSLKEERVERAIRRELCKTHSVLKSVRSNIESVEQNRKPDNS